jgi:hypothetical protein
MSLVLLEFKSEPLSQKKILRNQCEKLKKPKHRNRGGQSSLEKESLF